MCIAKTLDNFKGDFLSSFFFFLHPQIPDFQLYLGQIFVSHPNKPYINGKLIYSAFRWCINLNFENLTLKTGFVAQGHICVIKSDKNIKHV